MVQLAESRKEFIFNTYNPLILFSYEFKFTITNRREFEIISMHEIVSDGSCYCNLFQHIIFTNTNK